MRYSFLVLIFILSSAFALPRFGLILFYKASCPHCQRFDPIVRAFAERSQIPVLGFTLDHHPLPSFSDSVSPTRGELLHFFPDENIVVPALFLVDQKTQTIYPVMQGEASYQQLSSRLNELLHTIDLNKADTNNRQEFKYG